VPAQRIGDIVAGKRAITADTDLRICLFSAFLTAIGCAPKLSMTPKSLNVTWVVNYRKLSLGNVGIIIDGLLYPAHENVTNFIIP
jgi:hypothetical protein